MCAVSFFFFLFYFCCCCCFVPLNWWKDQKAHRKWEIFSFLHLLEKEHLGDFNLRIKSHCGVSYMIETQIFSYSWCWDFWQVFQRCVGLLSNIANHRTHRKRVMHSAGFYGNEHYLKAILNGWSYLFCFLGMIVALILHL